MLVSGENLTKCLRILNPHSEMKYESATLEDLRKKFTLYMAYEFNNIGCVHFKMEKYNIAA
jgi:CCR4-NOT transcription complex subunit 10